MRLDAWFAVMFSACVLCAGPAPARDRALVIGVNKYPNIVSNGMPGALDLHGSVTDAKTVVDLLVTIFKFDPADVKLLTDADATNRNILDGLQRWLIDGTRAGDRVAFYFSGHGATAEVREPGQAPRLTSTIVPSDASGDLDKPNAVVSGMIQGKTIGEYLARMSDRHIMVIADSCFSGSVTRGFGEPAGPPDVMVRTITPGRPVGVSEEQFTREVKTSLKVSGRLLDVEPRAEAVDGMAVWSAATINQESWDTPSGGVFTQGFAEVLRDRQAAPGGKVTAGRVYNLVRDKSKAFCEQNSKCKGLTPELKAPAAYRDLVLNPYQPPGSAPPSDAGPPVADAVESLLSHKNDFPLRAEILPGTRIKLSRPGRESQVRFRITSGEPGTLVVLDSSPDGKLHQIFPNRPSQQNNKGGHVNAGAPITIPDASYGFAFRATDQGPGTLLVLVAEQALDLSGVIDRNLDFKAITNPRGLAVELADRVEAPLISPDLTVPNRGYRWAFVAIPYVIEP